MATSDTEICNMALTQVGANRIISLNDNSVEAKLCKDNYANIRDEMLRSHPWKFAKVRVSLALLTTKPAFGFANAFQLPADCLRVFKMMGDESYSWQVIGKTLVTDSDEAYIEYVKRAEPFEMDPSFIDALVSKIAYKLSFSLVQSVTLRESLKQEAKDALTTARSFNGQEGAGDRVYADDWLNSRA